MSPLRRLSPRRRTTLLQLAAVISLLALGLIIGLTIMWALIAIPMVVVVLLFLMELQEARAQVARVVNATPADPSLQQPDGSTGIIVRSGDQRQRGPLHRRSARVSR